MTARRPCPPAPGPLETNAAQFAALFHALAQRQAFRTYLTGLLAPRDRPKTLTALAGAAPLVPAQAAPVQQLQFLLSESNWDTAALTARTLEVLAAQRLLAPTAEGVLVLDETGARKEDHVAGQYLGLVGKIDNGIVAATSLWANAQRYYPLHTVPYTPESRLPGGKHDPAFCTKPHIVQTLVAQAQAAGIPFKDSVADCLYGDHPAGAATLRQRQLPFMPAHCGSVGRGWAPQEDAHSFTEALQTVRPGDWHRVRRRFWEGHVEHW